MLRSGSALDPVTVEVVRHKLDGIANEMELTLLKSSFSPIVKEGLDASASLFTLQGETLAQAVAIPIHLATLIPCIARILAEFPIETMREGDLYCLNDPYIGGTHLPDIAVIMPVFARGRPLAFAAAMTHHQDIGGMAPGSVPTDATEIFQEGIRLPALKLRDGDRFNDTLLKILRRNVRIPDTFEGDLMAQVAACNVGARRLSALAETYGDNHLTAIFAELLDRSEAMTRDALRAIPKGTYSAVDFLDNDGIELDRRIRIEVAVTVDDGAMTIDFAGSSPQVRGPFNVVPSGSLAAACYVVRANCLRRRAARRHLLRNRRAGRWRLRRERREGRGRRDRDRRHKLHEPAGRGARARCSDPGPSRRVASRFRRRRCAAGRPRRLARIRAPTRRSPPHPPRRAALHRAEGSRRRTRRRDGPHRHLSRRRRRAGRALQAGDDAACRRPGRVRDRGRRRLW